MTSDDALLWTRERVASQYCGSSTLTAAILSGEHDDQSPVHDYAAAYRAGHAAAQSEAEARVRELEVALRDLLGQVEQGHLAFMVEQSASVAEATAKAHAALEGRQP